MRLINSGTASMVASTIILLALMTANVCTARVYNVSSLAWLSFQGKLIDNEQLLSSQMIIPIAIKHFNTRNGSIVPAVAQMPKSCTSTLQLVDGLKDSAGETNLAIEQMLDAYNNYKVDVILGPVRSNVAGLLGVTGGALKIPMITHSATAESLSDKQIYPTLFRVNPSDGQFAEVISQLFEIFNFTKVGMFNVDDTFGRDFRDSLFTACQTRRITVRSYFFNDAAAGEDLYRSVKQGLSGFVQERISIIFYAGLTSQLDRALARAANELDWIKGKLYIGQRDTVTEVFGIADAAEKKLLRRFFRGSLFITRAFDTHNPQWVRLKNAWPTFDVNDVNPYLPNGTTSGGDPYQLPNTYFHEDEPNSPAYRSYANAYDFVIAVGIASCGSRRSFFENLKLVQFEGTTGTVKFDTSLNRASSTTYYALQNTVSDPSDSFTGLAVKTVGAFQDLSWEFNSPIIFSDGTSTPPLDVAPPKNVVDSLPLGAKVFGCVEAGVGMTISLWALFKVVIARKTSAFVNAQPIFMMILIAGCVVMAASIVPLTIETDAGCMLFPWLFSIGFVLTLSSLIVKSVRVAILWFGSGQVTRRSRLVKAQVLLVGVVFIMSILLAILLAWQLVAPLHIQLVTTRLDADGFPIASSLMCVLSSDASVAFIALVGAFVCSLMVVTVIVSLWVRNAPEKFQEAKMTAVAGLILFQLFFIGVPTAVVVWGSALPRFLVVSSIVFLLTMTVLLTLFFPKIYKWRFTAWNLIPLTSFEAQQQQSMEDDARMEGVEGESTRPSFRRVNTMTTNAYSVVELIDHEKRTRMNLSKYPSEHNTNGSRMPPLSPTGAAGDGVNNNNNGSSSGQQKTSSSGDGDRRSRGGSSTINRVSFYPNQSTTTAMNGRSSPVQVACRETLVVSSEEQQLIHNEEEEKQQQSEDYRKSDLISLSTTTPIPTTTQGDAMKPSQHIGASSLLESLSTKRVPPAFFFESQPLVAEPPVVSEPATQRITAPVAQPFQTQASISFAFLKPADGEFDENEFRRRHPQFGNMTEEDGNV